MPTPLPRIPDRVSEEIERRRYGMGESEVATPFGAPCGHLLGLDRLDENAFRGAFGQVQLSWFEDPS